MSLKPFQQATVNLALRRLKDSSGSGRFLVADEVGLGKTLVAQGVIKGLLEQRRPLRVFYVCSSLSIAHQNRDNLLEVLPAEERESAKVEVDRLTLLPTDRQSPKAKLVLYTLTPGTMPLRSRGGRVDERALLAHLLRDTLDLRRDNRVLNLLGQGVLPETWSKEREATEKVIEHVPSLLRGSFRRHVTRLLNRADAAWSSTIVDELVGKLEEDRGTAIQLLRQALSLAALDSLAPDLIIFDEFQRFFELFDADDEDSDDVARSLMDRLLGVGNSVRAKVLMLSATPYRLFGGWDGGDGAHHEQLFRLLRFLFGGGENSAVSRLKKDFDEYGQRLRNDAPGTPATLEVRDRIELALGKVMARTERTDSDSASSVGRPRSVTTELNPLDVRLLRHLRDSARAEDRWFVQSIWSSVPYPLQAMDANGYQLREHASELPLNGDSRQIGIGTAQVNSYSSLEHPHPKLRQLFLDVPPELLALPWLPPTKTWWPLAGQFAEAVNRVGSEKISKTLIFSRYRAVPRALASVLSYEAERKAFAVGEQRGRQLKKIRHYDYRARSSGSDPARKPKAGRHPQPRPAFTFVNSKLGAKPLKLVLEFFPLPVLAAIGDPLQALKQGCQANEDALVRFVVERLSNTLGRRPDDGRSRSLGGWVHKLEQKSESWNDLRSSWEASFSFASVSDAAATAARSFLDLDDSNTAPTERELERLARLALFSPGCVLLRAVERVFLPPADRAVRLASVLRISVGAFRGYLDSPEFHKLFERKDHRDHRLAVRKAIFDGNLESVLDEYLAVLGGLGEKEIPAGREERALEALETALQIRTSSIEFNKLGRTGKFKLRCHAALPFGLTASEVVSESTKKLRSDFLRVAFNSPFRPFVLATTSIGQEGLDFHTYCNHLIHWDLPSNPVDLEQREGRIRRFGSLGVRKGLALVSVESEAGTSPWRAIALAVRERSGGLEPWWSTKGAQVRTSAYLAPFSREEGSLQRLLSALALYRMTLGQPDQEQLVHALQRRVEDAGAARTDLEAWFRKVRIRLSPFAWEKTSTGG